MKMTISNDMIDQIKVFEGFELRAYLDVAGIPTIGIGHTGEDVRMGDIISNDEAVRLFRQDVANAEKAVNNLNNILLERSKGYGGLSQRQFDALVSIVYNVGAGCIGTSSTLYKVLTNGGRSNYADVCHAFMLWVKVTDPKTKQKVTSGGKDGKHGLVGRRAREAAWYVYGANWDSELNAHGIKDVVEWARS